MSRGGSSGKRWDGGPIRGTQSRGRDLNWVLTAPKKPKNMLHSEKRWRWVVRGLIWIFDSDRPAESRLLPNGCVLNAEFCA
jgi:hypothetical protein